MFAYYDANKIDLQDRPPRLRTNRRINAPSWLLAFAHTQGEAGTPMGGIWSAVVGRNIPVLCAGWVLFPVCVKNDPIFASFDTAPSPLRQANQCT
jgi:hypothetical protein